MTLTQIVEIYHQQGHQHGNSSGSAMSEMSELRDMLREQQQQLNQLTQSMAQLQNPQSRSRPFKANLICRRCQQPGDFARDCDGERTSVRPPSARVNSALTRGEQPSSIQPLEN